MQSSELLLPVGNMEMALAAIHNGADAIYMGVPGFNARGRTQDFDLATLDEMIQTCHLYGVKVNLAFNVVIFEEELDAVSELLQQIIPLRPDAFIVQDIGLARLIRSLSSEQVIHGSTQMTVTNHEAINLLADLKIKRFVLGRENSLKEIALIKEKTKSELEVFVHGALCVAYSGQCFTSESIGGRSANRGQCAQSCRFEYEMWVDGEKKNLVDKNYLVSPQDLCGIAEIPELLKLKIDSFKIEGRLKTPEYVASTARSYRQAIKSHLGLEEINQLKNEMAIQYSRGFFPGWLNGVDHQRLVEGSYNAHRGALLGTIKTVKANSIVVLLENQLEVSLGDGLMLATQLDGHKNETGSKIYEIKKMANGEVEFIFSKDFKLSKHHQGGKVYLNRDESLAKELSKSFQDRQVMKKIPVMMTIQVDLNAPLRAIISDGRHKVELYSDSLVVKAEKLPITKNDLYEEMSALGGTCFVLDKFELIENGQAYFINKRELKMLRQKLTGELTKFRSHQTIDGFDAKVNKESGAELLKESFVQKKNKKNGLVLNIVLREFSQVETFCRALDEGELAREFFGFIILDFEFGKDYQKSVSLLQMKNVKAAIATNRVLKPGEYHHFKLMERCKPDGLLIRNLGALHYFTEISPFSGPLLGDFSLNVTNHLSAEYLLDKGLESVCLSYDLNAKQVNDLVKRDISESLEITIYQYMPSFHMEHCVFAAFLSKGSSFRDCGKPCEKHKVELVDQFGHRHFIKADQECRNTMFNGTAQSALSFIDEWSSLGVNRFRFEALFEDGETLKKKIKDILEVISGKFSSEEVQQKLGGLEKYGLSQGSFENVSHRHRKK